MADRELNGALIVAQRSEVALKESQAEKQREQLRGLTDMTLDFLNRKEIRRKKKQTAEGSAMAMGMSNTKGLIERELNVLEDLRYNQSDNFELFVVSCQVELVTCTH